MTDEYDDARQQWIEQTAAAMKPPTDEQIALFRALLGYTRRPATGADHERERDAPINAA
ncbi:MAG: hypothetical protein ACRDT0_23665 [Pseudonocardiaceae bacterium]